MIQVVCFIKVFIIDKSFYIASYALYSCEKSKVLDIKNPQYRTSKKEAGCGFLDDLK